jgi:multicomponent Na+:H+ antiporter subunit B
MTDPLTQPEHAGMTLIVRTTARLIIGFIAVFGVYIALTGHISPGGGFAGGVILAAAAALIVLAFGGSAASKLINETVCHTWDAAGAMGFLVVALCGYFMGSFFTRFVPVGRLHHLLSGGTIPLSNLAILVKVGAGLAGAFLALAAFRRARTAETNELPEGAAP